MAHKGEALPWRVDCMKEGQKLQTLLGQLIICVAHLLRADVQARCSFGAVAAGLLCRRRGRVRLWLHASSLAHRFPPQQSTKRQFQGEVLLQRMCRHGLLEEGQNFCP